MNPEHLTQLPEDVRATLAQLEAQFAADDRRLEAALLAAARTTQLTARVPALCDALMAKHPLLSKRAVFRAVSLSTGIHVKNIQKLFYGRPKCSK